MYTQCPQCLTVYLLDAEILGAGRGDVRCGRCRAVFCALDAIADEPPGDGIITPSFPEASPPVIEPLEDDFYAADHEEDDLEDLEAMLDRFDLAVESGEEALDDAPVVDEILEALPSARAAESDAPATGWRAAAVLLALALVGQLAWYERERLLEDPATRGWVESACALVGCELPLRRDLAQIRLASRDIRPHPSVEGALIINATLHNQAPFRQPYPELVVRLSDLEGQPVAARRFLPADYLERPDLADVGIAPETLVPLVFEVVDPGSEAVAFEFDFR